MKIGLLLASVLMSKRYGDRIFAPKDLFVDLVNGLVKNGHEVYVYTSAGIDIKGTLISGSKELENKDFYSVRDTHEQLGEKLSFVRTNYEYQLDLSSKAFLHGNTNKLDIMHVFLGELSSYFVNFSNFPVVFTVHDPVFAKTTLESLRYGFFPNHNHIAISDSQKKSYIDLLKINMVARVYHGLDINKFSFSDRPTNYLVFLGRYLKEKGVVDAIKAAIASNILLKLGSSNNYTHTMYYQNEIKPYLSNNLVIESEYMTSLEEKSGFLNQAKAMLFPIKWEEPFGMVMIEAMACGTPVIAYNRGSVSEIVRDGLTGFIIDPDNEDRPGKGTWIIKKQGIEGLVEAIKRIGEIDRKACRKHVQDYFTVDMMVNNYEKVYKEVINKNKI